MLAKNWLKGCLILAILLFVAGGAVPMEAWARAGGGRSMGSRGMRSTSPPRPYTAPQPTQPRPSPGVTSPYTPSPRTAAPTPSSSGSFWRSFGGGLLGGLAGGMLFRSLFGGPSANAGNGAGGGGIGMFDILLLAGIAYLIYWYIKKKRAEATANSGYYQSTGNVELPRQPNYPPVYEQPQAEPVLASPDHDLEQGLAHIRQFDPAFDEGKFQDAGMDIFFKIQGAWANRDMAPVRVLLTDEMYRILQSDADKLKAEKKINRLDNIAVRSVDITEAWQEAGRDFITARIYANLLDYNVNEATGELIDGSKTEPVKFEEYWTFTRSVGSNPWQLAAIQQPT